MLITQIHSNVKRDLHVSEIGRYNLIVGPNGSGKTSLINSIQLALGGFVSDLFGKDNVKKSGDIITLAYKSKQLESELTFDDGSTANYLVRQTTKGAGRPAHKCKVDYRFPYDDVKVALSGSSEKVRQWLLENALDSVTESEIKDQLPKGLQEEYVVLAKGVNGRNLTDVDRLIGVIDLQKSAVKRLKSEIKGLQESVEKWKSSLDVRPTHEEIQQAGEQLQQATKALHVFEQENHIGIGHIPKPEEIEKALEHARGLAEKLKAAEEKKAKVAHLSIQSLSESEKFAYKTFLSAQELIKAMKALNKDQCVVCNSYVSSWDGHVARLHEENKELSAKEQVYRIWTDLNHEISRLQGETLEAVQAWKALTEAGKLTYDGDKYAVLMGEKDKARKAYMDVLQCDSSWKDLLQMEERVKEKTTQQKAAEKMQREAAKVSRKLVQDSISSFCDKVNAHLDGDVFHMDVKATSVKYGFKRDGEMVSALSGEEYMRLTFAIACAISTEGTLNVFIPEDRALTEESLKRLITSLSSAQGQVFLTSTFEVDVPSTWTIIKMENTND